MGVQDFLTTQRADIDLTGFLVNLVLAGLLCYLLGRLYIRYGHSLSNRRLFAQNFVLLGMTTLLIITVVKSSLALSLGLVGALSIVRFRAAIKEPEELAYLFLVISIGLGLGADQRLITLSAFVPIGVVIWLKSLSRQSNEDRNLHLTVSSRNPKNASLATVVGVLERHCPEISLKRIDETVEALEVAFLVSFEGLPQLQSAIAELRSLDDTLAISFLDYQGIGA